jgi:hypothetical protein
MKASVAVGRSRSPLKHGARPSKAVGIFTPGSIPAFANLLVVCATFPVLVCCSSTSKMSKPLTDFNAATTETTTVTTSVLAVVQTADQEEAVLKASKLKVLKERDIPEFLRPNDLLQRQLTLQALSTYTITLKTLAGVDRSADIQKSFDSLKTSIDSTVTTINKLSTDSKTQIPSGVVSGLVSLGSNLVIAYAAAEREKAIRAALEKSDSTVAKICRLLASELEPHGVIYDELKHAYQAQEEEAIDSFQSVVDSASSGGNDKGKDASKPGETPNPSATVKFGSTPKPSELAPYAKALLGLRNKKEYSLALLGSLASSYRKLAQAHTALKLQSETGTKSDLQLRALISELDNVNFFQSQIK